VTRHRRDSLSDAGFEKLRKKALKEQFLKEMETIIALEPCAKRINGLEGKTSLVCTSLHSPGN
jgi:hypothetical protein